MARTTTTTTTTRIAAGQERESVAEVKQSLFTLWTADLMLERDHLDARTHTLYAPLWGRPWQGWTRLEGAYSSIIITIVESGHWPFTTEGGVSEVFSPYRRLVSPFVVRSTCAYYPGMYTNTFIYTVAKSLYKHALQVNAHTACKYFTNISIGSALLPPATLIQSTRTAL